MGSEAGEMVRLAVEATIHGDLDMANRVMQIDDRIDEFEQDAFRRAMVIIMQEAPVSDDLRLLVATMGIVGEIENAGDDAVKLARRAAKLTMQFPSELKLSLRQLGDAARRSLASAIKLYSEYTPELAAQIVADDRQIDSDYAKARDQVFEMIRANPEQTKHLVRTIEAFHALEHVADHAVSIARRMQLMYATPNLPDSVTQ